MSSRKAELYIQDIVQACNDIHDFTLDIQTADDLENDRRTFLAVIRSLEVIGEAARQMPKGFREKHTEIPWREIASFRNVLAHEYFGLDIDIVWNVIQTQIPILLEKIKSLQVI